MSRIHFTAATLFILLCACSTSRPAESPETAEDFSNDSDTRAQEPIESNAALSLGDAMMDVFEKSSYHQTPAFREGVADVMSVPIAGTSIADGRLFASCYNVGFARGVTEVTGAAANYAGKVRSLGCLSAASVARHASARVPPETLAFCDNWATESEAFRKFDYHGEEWVEGRIQATRTMAGSPIMDICLDMFEIGYHYAFTSGFEKIRDKCRPHLVEGCLSFLRFAGNVVSDAAIGMCRSLADASPALENCRNAAPK